jgi:hypothetical protein
MSSALLVRTRGMLSVAEDDKGWSIIGHRVTGQRFRMVLPRCTCTRHVCPTLHNENTGYSSCRAPTLLSHGTNAGHGHNHCHGNHAVRVNKVIDLLANTYGRSVAR